MRLSLCSSTSVIAVAVLLVTVNVTGPAFAVLLSMLQVPPPSLVMLIATCDTPFDTAAVPALLVASAVPDALAAGDELPELEQAPRMTASAAAAPAAASGLLRRTRYDNGCSFYLRTSVGAGAG
jgi:hypothetical protein